MSVILDLCGGTGSWSKPYSDAGYDVRVITLPDYDVEHIDFAGDHFTLYAQNMHVRNMDIPYAEIFGIFAAPPCTEFSIAKNGHHRERDFTAGMKTVRACMNIIWSAQERGRLKFWALENPRGYLRRFLGVPRYTFEQWQFGGRYVKATDVWGFFRIPTPTVKDRPEGMTVRNPNGRTNSRFWEVRSLPGEHAAYLSQFGSDDKRAAIRAITPPGFAEAFYKANS
jgi:hypothetical protein